MSAAHRRVLVGWRLILVIATAVPAAACWRSGPARETARAQSTLASIPCRNLTYADARCSTLAVAENRERPNTRAISLYIVVLPAIERGAARDPVFYLPGGPGQAATEMLVDPAVANGSLRRRRDLVFVDQRGTGASHRLECRFYGPPEQPQRYLDPFMPIDRVKACRDALSSTADLSQYTTAASVADLDEVRAALGYDTINLIGGSYGTRLAMEYLRQHERHVRAVILESAVPPTTAMPEDFGRLAQYALDVLLDECLSDAACGRTFPRIREEARAVFDRLRRGPVEATVTHRATGIASRVSVSRDNVAEAIRYMTYAPRTASRVPLYLHEAFEGDYSPIAQYLVDWRGDGSFDGLYLSITCAEDVPFVRESAAEDDDRTYLGGYRVREQRAACREWPRGPVPAFHRQPVTSTRPVLIISGRLDPVTPPAFGNAVASTLPNSLHLTVPHAGHSTRGLIGDDCLANVRRDFIEHARTDAADTRCVATMARSAFMLHR